MVEEEIYGAPPAPTRAEIRESRLSEQFTVNRYVYHQAQQLELMLLGAEDLQALLEVLLVSLPRHFGLSSAELWLYDPEGVLAGLIVGGQRYGYSLQLHRDVFDMQELYELEPDIVLLDATDSRMFEVLKSEHGIQYAMLLPLLDSGRLMGSLHLGSREDTNIVGESEEDVMAQLAAVASNCFKNAVRQQQISQLTLLDPLTQISNVRGFRKDIAREIARARRADQPLGLLLMEIDEYDDLLEYYGENAAHFTMKKVVERVSSDLRATDLLARLSRSRIAVLLPACNESKAMDIAERMRGDIEDFSVDDGRGAVIQATLSVGVTSWTPQQYPAIDMVALAEQMQTVSTQGLENAVAAGGNKVAVSRLSVSLL